MGRNRILYYYNRLWLYVSFDFTFLVFFGGMGVSPLSYSSLVSELIIGVLLILSSPIRAPWLLCLPSPSRLMMISVSSDLFVLPRGPAPEDLSTIFLCVRTES